MEITDRRYGRLAGDEVKNKIAKKDGQSDQVEGDDDLFRQFVAFQEWRKKQDRGNDKTLKAEMDVIK